MAHSFVMSRSQVRFPLSAQLQAKRCSKSINFEHARCFKLLTKDSYNLFNFRKTLNSDPMPEVLFTETLPPEFLTISLTR